MVNNIAPTIRIESAGELATGTISLTGVVTDPGASETETLSWTLNGNGTITIGRRARRSRSRAEPAAQQSWSSGHGDRR